MRNQNKIYGDYSIVSVFQAGDRPQWNMERHNDTMLGLLEQGFTVRQLHGQWNGVKELSIEISGPGHAEEALDIARAYNQEAYIVVGNGQAVSMEVCEVQGRQLYLATTVFTRIEEVTDFTQNYTGTGQGFYFRFV